MLNTPRPIAAAVSSGLCTYVELDTVLSVADMWNLIEINQVNNFNRSLELRDLQKHGR